MINRSRSNSTKVRSTGEQASTEDLLRIAKVFKDDFMLDNLSRPQLVSMCRYMNINAFGTDNFLRYQISNRMRVIKEDDKVRGSENKLANFITVTPELYLHWVVSPFIPTLSLRWTSLWHVIYIQLYPKSQDKCKGDMIRV